MRGRSFLFEFLPFVVAGCSSSGAEPSQGAPDAPSAADSGTVASDVGVDGVADSSVVTDAGPSGDGAAVDASDPNGLTVQEWGTYTSVQASDGHSLGGVHHEDEALPEWVHRRNFTDQTNYYFEQLPEEPLQQLETPVLYFWSPTAVAAHVEVDFPEGVVGQWYPDATTFAPAIGSCTEVGKGTMAWDVDVDPAIDPASFAAVDPNEIWAPSRHVASTPIRGGAPGGAEETEQFIFYRGLAKFDPPMKLTESTDGSMHLTNSAPEGVAAAFVLHVDGTHGEIVSLGAVAGGATVSATIPAATRSMDDYLARARAMISAALVESGLKDDVAQAMVDTWTRSWFENVGLRVLYVAPRAWTNGWLPTTVTPTPSSFVRTLVGRIETLTPRVESGDLAAVRAHLASGETFDLTSLGRFAEPRLRRVAELLTDANELAYAKKLIDQAHALR